MITLEIKGIEATLKALDSLEKKIAAKVLKATVQAGKAPIIAAARALAPVETQALKKAIGDKQKSYRGGRIHTAIIGARTGFKRQVERTFSKRGKQRIKLKKMGVSGGGRQEVRDPSKYLHLAEGGRQAVQTSGRMPIRVRGGGLVFSKSARAAKGSNFMRRAFEQSKAQALAAMLAVLKPGVEEAVRSSAAA